MTIGKLAETYPQTAQALGQEFDFLARSFLRDFPDSSWWPSFLREKRIASKIYELASLEGALQGHKVIAINPPPESVLDIDSGASLEIDPEFCRIEIHHENLGLQPGNWLVSKELTGAKLYRLDPQDLVFFEFLEEGLALPFLNLVELASAGSAEKTDSEKKLSRLINIGVIRTKRRSL